MAASMKSECEVDDQKSPCKTKRKKYSHIKEKADQFLSSREHSNLLVELVECTQEKEKGAVLAAIKALHQVFSTLLKRGSMVLEERQKGTNPSTSEHKYREWLQGVYRDCVTCLAELVSDEGSPTVIQELSLCTLMKLMEAENQHPLIQQKEDNAYTFEQTILSLSLHTLMRLMEAQNQHPLIQHKEDVNSFEQTALNHLVPNLITNQRDQKDLLGRFQEYMEYDDLRLYLLTRLSGHLQGMANRTKNQSELSQLCHNTLALLEMVNMPTTEEDIRQFLGKTPNPEDDVKVLSLSEHRRAFSKAWLTFLKLKLPSAVYKRVLVILHDKVIPHMSSPVLLTDFLTSSYNIGGAISLLALNGLFILITKYNLEYPDFYTKLYNLFEPSIFHVKYKARFFHLTDLFLTSTHLPSYLVAAFAKRLSRLCLVAPPNALEYVIPFIINLFVRHPNCSILVHRTEGVLDFTSDPYLHEETDPAKCRAMDSCLWEIESLQSHYHHGVATLAKRIHQPLSKNEEDLEGFLDLDISDMISKETQKKVSSVPLEFQPAKQLFGGHKDQFSSDFWSWG